MIYSPSLQMFRSSYLRNSSCRSVLPFTSNGMLSTTNTCWKRSEYSTLLIGTFPQVTYFTLATLENVFPPRSLSVCCSFYCAVSIPTCEVDSFTHLWPSLAKWVKRTCQITNPHSTTILNIPKYPVLHPRGL